MKTLRYINLLLAPYLIIFLCACFANMAAAESVTGFSVVREPLTLMECIKFSAQNSFEIKLARVDFLIAETDISIAEAIFDTSLFGNIGYEKDKREQNSIFAPNVIITNTYSAGVSKTLPLGTELRLSFSDERQWSDSDFVTRNPYHAPVASVELRQPLAKNYFGYADRRILSSTLLAVESAGLDTQEKIEILFADVERAYWRWIFAKRNLESYREILKMAEELHKSNILNYDVGGIEKGDFLASQANVLVRKKDFLIFENGYRRAEETIKMLMNMDADYRITPSERLGYAKRDLSLKESLKRAFESRRDYEKKKTDLEKEAIILETKSNDRWPEIDLIASMKANGINSDFGRATDRIGTGNADYFAGVEVTISLENNQAKGEFEKARHKKEKAILELKNIERHIVTEVGNGFRDYVTYETNVSTLMEAAILQKDKLVEEQRRFNYGRSSTKTLIDYQQDYINAQMQVARGLLDLKLAGIDLDKALNIILEKYKGLL